MKVVGFTGTRHGLTHAQRARLVDVLSLILAPTEFHHGSCQGADVEAAALVRYLRPDCQIVCHPGPEGDSYQRVSGVDDERRPPKTHFARNRDIVDESECLVACPCDMREQPRGGTWYTIGHARKKGKPRWIVWPDGTLTEEQ